MNSPACKPRSPLLKTGHHAALDRIKMTRGELWPNFFIVGAPRSGTTSLYEYLSRVPGIYMSPVKEPRYFDSIDHFAPYAPKPIRDREKYLRLFAGVKDEKLVGEASPSYLMDAEAPRRIAAVAPDARIVMILRDPIEQIYSAYLLHRRARFHRLPLDEAIQLDLYLRPAFYAAAVKRYLDVFGAGRVKILVFEEFACDPRGAVGEILRFLGARAEPPAAIGEAHNAFGAPRSRWTSVLLQNPLARRVARRFLPDRFRRRVREKVLFKPIPKPPIPAASKKFLAELFRDDVLGLEKILARPLPWFHRENSA